MLKIWGRANSSNVQKVMWAVGELGLAHERIDAQAMPHRSCAVFVRRK